MNDYIINPSWFYWISVCEGVKIFCYIIGVLSISGAVICTMNYFLETGFNDDKAKLNKKLAVRFGVAVIVVALIAILIPSKETLVQMKLAELITYDNANKAIELIQDATDYILDHVSGK